MVTSDFRPEVEIWQFGACAMKNMQHNCYYRNSSIIMDLAMGQIPCFTECITSFKDCFSHWYFYFALLSKLTNKQ